jgi:hypothetical protein
LDTPPDFGSIDPATGTMTEFNTTTTLAGGPIDIVAGSDGNLWFDMGFAAQLPDQIGQVNLGLAPVVVSLTTSTDTTLVGQPITFDATVAPLDGTGTPTGTVTLFVSGKPQATEPLAQRDGQNQATLTYTPPAQGFPGVSVIYSGDGTYAPGEPDVIPVLEIGPFQTTTFITSMQTTATVGQLVTITARVNWLGDSGLPTGTIEFSSPGNSPVLDPVDVPLELVNGLPQATFTTSLLDAGTHTINATYFGDGLYLSSAAMPLTVTINAAPSPPPPVLRPPQPPTVSVIHRARGEVKAIGLSIGEALDPASADNRGFYRLLGAVRTNGKVVFARKLAIKSVVYSPTTETVTIALARPYKRGVQINIRAGLTAASGLQSSSPFSIVVK